MPPLPPGRRKLEPLPGFLSLPVSGGVVILQGLHFEGVALEG